MPIFVGAKIACLLLLPALTYLTAVLLGYTTGRQVLATVASLVVAMMLPNWVISMIRRPYQQALRRGIPDALDLLVVCAEAGTRARVSRRTSGAGDEAVEPACQRRVRSVEPRDADLPGPQDRPDQSFRALGSTRLQASGWHHRADTEIWHATGTGASLARLGDAQRTDDPVRGAGRQASALLVLPMIGFILPCLFIILMGRPAIQIMSAVLKHALIAGGIDPAAPTHQFCVVDDARARAIASTSLSDARSPSNCRERS